MRRRVFWGDKKHGNAMPTLIIKKKVKSTHTHFYYASSYTYIYIKFSDFERKRPFLSATTSPNTTARCTISSLRAREWCRDDFSFSSFLRFFFVSSFLLLQKFCAARSRRSSQALLLGASHERSQRPLDVGVVLVDRA